jgi:hypothetical protein
MLDDLQEEDAPVDVKDEEVQADLEALERLLASGQLPEIEAALKQFGEARLQQGNIEYIIRAMPKWADSEHPWTACVRILRGKEGISDPERLCGWLKARAVEAGVLPRSVYERKSELGDLSGKVLRHVALIGAGQPRLKGIPRLWREVGQTPEGRSVIEFPVAIANVPDPVSGFSLTQQDLEELARNFESAREAGVDVGVKLDHPDQGPRIGDVVDVWVEGNLLWVRAVEHPRDALPATAVPLRAALSGSYPHKSIEYWQLSEGRRMSCTVQFNEEAFMSHRAEDQAVFERLQSLEAEVTRLKEENEALRQKLRLSELQALIRDQGLDKAVADPAVRRHLPEILLQAESVTIRLGESTRRLSDIIVQILRAKALPVGALPVEEGEPEWERLARRIAGVPDGGSK